ncbi:MAG: anti-sigma factor, partial [Janibacter sp.]|nr:anti-sigma factor [Janibacter sp.]
ATVVPLRRRVSRQWAALAAAAALVVGGGVTWQIVEQVTTSAADEVLAAADAQSWQTTTADGGTVRVVRSDQLGKAVLRVEGLADPGSGKAYQAWLQDSSGSMVPAGIMTSTDGEMLLEGDVDSAAGVGVTMEPAGGSPQPTSDPVALIELV